ncbi:hypothetical protein [Nostoc sp. ChiSLP03a]|uniref:hypothetical protein n=1 Tax=Nostoc sp. ChiSLP03a TaxID=3075380 RepID=UPI002AD339EC|nr:hypothetical protein [Nostoc sp. ChiSLP03a]MDZ8216505.1 hypothetical protein [Nostoc sp. ChiSLP03a]
MINRCESHDELDFLFPEIIRIKNHYLAVLDSWQNHVNWIQSLPSSELKLLSSADFNSPDTYNSTINLAEPPEQLVYESLAEKSHFYSLRDQLLFLFEPELRQEYEFYISEHAAITGYKTLVTSNLQQASDLTIGNLYYYFKVRDKSKNETELVSAN